MSKKVFILVELPIEQAVALESIVGDMPYNKYIEKLVTEHISAQHRVQSDGATRPAQPNCGDRDCFQCNPPRR